MDKAQAIIILSEATAETLLSVQVLALATGIPKSTIYSWTRDDLLRHFQSREKGVLRVFKRDWDDFIQKNMKGPHSQN